MYFGKFYGSVKTNFRMDIPLVFPLSINGYFVMNRWDYFQSFATFFEDVRPSFLVQNEMYGGEDEEVKIEKIKDSNNTNDGDDQTKKDPGFLGWCCSTRDGNP